MVIAEKAFACDFNYGCLCYFTMREEVNPDDFGNWNPTADYSFEGDHSLVSQNIKFDDLTNQAVLKTIPFNCKFIGNQFL